MVNCDKSSGLGISRPTWPTVIKTREAAPCSLLVDSGPKNCTWFG